jgi:phage portal protein BeeE
MHTITPWLRRLEIGLSKILPMGTDIVFDVASLLRSDSMTRATVNKLNIETGQMTPKEARMTWGLEPYEGGDEFHQALSGTVLAGGELPALGVDSDPSAPVMGVLESNG